MVIITANSDNGAPNLLLNCYDKVGRTEIYLAAALGVILQLGAIIYFGFITYHKPIQSRFLKDGNRVVKYAFPCAAIGTILLVLGLFICSWVVGESTKETYYAAENHDIFVVWLQKHHTVSDQEFKPYAIYPASKRKYITMSRRNMEDRPQANGGHAGSIDETDKYWPLKLITVAGSLISLMGFISQFIGMRGLNWTASIVQLGITIVVTILRVIVRRGLGKSPARTHLSSKFELDWFALSFGNLAEAPWISPGGKPGHLDNQSDELRANWEICTGRERAYPSLDDRRTSASQCTEMSKPYQIMLARTNLRRFSEYNSPVLEAASCLSRAIEAVAHAFLNGLHKTYYEWRIPAKYTGRNSPEPEKGNICITISKDKQHRWCVEEAEIEAILSLWLYSTSSTKNFNSTQQRNLRFYGPSESEERLIRDLEWWMPENIPTVSKYSKDDVVRLTSEKSGCMAVGFLTEYDDEGESTNTETDNDSKKLYLALEGQDKPAKLVSRDLLFSFIRAVAKMPEVGIASASSAHPLSYTKMDKGWKQMKLKNDFISNLARRLEKIGFGTLPDIYIDLIMPLSLEQKLTDVKNIIVDAQIQAYEYERSRQWNKLASTCHSLLDLALQFDLEKESSGPLAIAVCLGFLYKLNHEKKLQESERRNEDELITQLKNLKDKFTDKRIKNSTYYSAIMSNEEKYFAISLKILAGTKYSYTTSFPKSYQIAEEQFRIMKEIESKQILRIQDFDMIKKTDAFGWSPLHYAAKSTLRGIDADEGFRLSDESSNLQDLMGWTPLHHACFYGNERVVQMLLRSGSPIEIAGKDGITPMHCAAQSGKIEIIKDLIKKTNPRGRKNNRSSHYVDRNERHPIHWAAVEGNLDVVRLMKDDINLTDRFGWTSLHLAAIYGHKHLLKYIAENYAGTMDINARDNESRTPLHLAVENGSIVAVQILIDAGAKLDAGAKNGSTPLHEAINRNHILIAKKLINQGVNTEATDMEGRTPLHLAVEKLLIRRIILLIDKGARVKTAAKDGRTPLHAALSHGQRGLRVAQMLLAAGADVNAKAQDGSSVLHIVAQCSDLFGLLNILSKLALDVDSNDEYGQTPLLIAIYMENWKAAELLLEIGASIEADKRGGYTPLLGAVKGGNEDILQQLLDRGANVNDADEDGYSALHLAVVERNPNIIRRLLDAGARINAVDILRHETPLQIAIRNGYSEIVQILHDSGTTTMSPNIRDFSQLQSALDHGKFPALTKLIEHKNLADNLKSTKSEMGNILLHAISACELNGEAKCIMFDELLRLGLDIHINAKNTKGNTPLDTVISEANGYCPFISKLLGMGAEPGSEDMQEELENWKRKYAGL